jgi:hypothetical protein
MVLLVLCRPSKAPAFVTTEYPPACRPSMALARLEKLAKAGLILCLARRVACRRKL